MFPKNRKKKGETKELRIESYGIRMDSEGTRSSGSTRKLIINLNSNGGVDDNRALNGSFADTYSALGNQTSEEADTKSSGANDADNAWNRVNAQNIRRANELSNSSPTAARDLQSVHQQYVLYLWKIFFGEEAAKKFSERTGIKDLSQESSSTSTNIPGMQVIKISGLAEYYSVETQSMSFSSMGHVTTEDGRSIDFRFDVSMTSRFEEYYASEMVDIAHMTDPLVLNFTGDVAELSDQKFTFDLDCDGEAEEISTLKSGNGFLALDKNGDGVINDGSELFGTKSGDGFKDLAQYDLDGNGWIDENDSIFNDLRVWYKDENGQDKLLNLKESGVGAIFLGNTASDYNLRSVENGHVNGAIRHMGVFLYENATVGSIAHLDIAN